MALVLANNKRSSLQALGSMSYLAFREEVLHQAYDRMHANYRKVTVIIRNQKNFKFQETVNHRARVDSFLIILRNLLGDFSSENYYSYSQTFNRCFVEEDSDCLLKHGRDLRHIRNMKRKARQKLVSCLSDLEDFAYFINERCL